MIRRTFGAPLGGTTCGAQYGLDFEASRLMVPPNFGGCGGRYFPSMVVVAPGEPGVPVICCARLVVTRSVHNTGTAINPRPASRGARCASNMAASGWKEGRVNATQIGAGRNWPLAPFLMSAR